ncbi:uncharacterized protein B0T15DRAFT_521509 [Chaetomium strumarium]|uniref:Uncharacterized protein n=1 Tax=Chaetomium strumarium TaxID=1170767 RepID=A0AAJ0H4M7_9PEZI|nr:hypothetical protein B0T15DRAFT_521509 [Chaetomium strumarium]
MCDVMCVFLCLQESSQISFDVVRSVFIRQKLGPLSPFSLLRSLYPPIRPSLFSDPPADKEQGTEFRCRTFIWSSDWNGRPWCACCFVDCTRTGLDHVIPSTTVSLRRPFQPLFSKRLSLSLSLTSVGIVPHCHAGERAF